MNTPRVLTHDEFKASEAAFRGKPFNPKWSKAAKAVYDGLVQAMGAAPLLTDARASFRHEKHEEQGQTEITVNRLNKLEPESIVIGEGEDSRSAEDSVSASTQVTSRDDAIRAGLVVDVSSIAKQVGLNLAVGITKSLWDRNISGVSEKTSEQTRVRVRDMLLAVRLRLATLETPTPWVEVPVLLPIPQDEKPEIFSIYALFHKDPHVSECLTLIHPQELSSINMAASSEIDESPSPDEVSP